MIRALIFDFDGLILDTEVPDYECWQEVYREHGCDLPLSLWAECIGSATIPFSPYDDLERRYGQPIRRSEIQASRRARYLARVEALSPLPGAAELITEAADRGLKLGIATSSTPGWADGHLTRLGLRSHFHCVKCAGDVQFSKPHPELYLAALEALDVEPEEAIAFEDSPNGIKAAKAAGIFCIAVPNPLTCHLPLEEADLRVSSLADFTLDDLLP